MPENEILLRLRRLQSEVDEIRRHLGFGSPGSVLYRAQPTPYEEQFIVVEADGFGGARTSTVEGNYPIDFLVLLEETFATEAAAIAA